ncbi:MAG: MBL fold metallo-hydrolase [Candidatus Thorarchaeota archaeon]|nr:MAG: MBL fold metallo-hydrolase [Candidatus Thorarchaeota archaeon]
MADTNDVVDSIRRLYSLTLEKKEIAFLYLGASRVIVRTDNGTAAIDTARFPTQIQSMAIKELDLILYTHTHSDHYNRGAARRLFGATRAHIVAERQVADDLEKYVPSDKLTSRNPEDKKDIFTVGNAKVASLVGVHPRPISMFRVSWGRTSIFHAGDSGYMSWRNFKSNVAFLPTGSPSPTCAPEVALAMAMDLQPSVAVAFHGTGKQTKRFKGLVEREFSDCEVIIPKMLDIVKLQL